MTARSARVVPATLLILAFALGCGCVAPQSPQDQAAKDVQAASDAARDKAREQLAKGEMVDVAAETDALRQTVSAAAANATGDDAAILRASSKVLAQIQDAAGKHQAALMAFLEAGGIDPAALKSADAVTTSRTRLDAFCSSNEDMRRFLVAVPDEFGRLARSEGASEVAAGAASRGFLSTFPQASLLRLRKLDADFCGHARNQLGILAEHSGSWQVDAEAGLRFGESVPETVVASYDESGDAILRIGAEQEELQRKLMEQ
jgi:hypothetical protein